jgi:hypothetical protein
LLVQFQNPIKNIWPLTFLAWYNKKIWPLTFLAWYNKECSV